MSLPFRDSQLHLQEVKRYERERRKNKSTYWITHELLWRDFVRFGSIYAGAQEVQGASRESRASWGRGMGRFCLVEKGQWNGKREVESMGF